LKWIEYAKRSNSDADQTPADPDGARGLFDHDRDSTTREGVKPLIAWYRQNPEGMSHVSFRRDRGDPNTLAYNISV
jgi:hypothetical protein